jgi:hypothetical protein
MNALTKAVALAMLALLAWGLSVYPASRPAMAAGLAVYAALLLYRPALWLLVVPAMLPVFDLAPWTGWFFFEELDLLLLATAAVGYWRWGPVPGNPVRLAPGVKPGLALVASCAAFAAWHGLQPLPPLDANSFSSYLSPYNSLRVAKGFAWAALLLPLMRRHAGEGNNLRRLFIPGMLLGLAAASLAVAWERAVFPGLMNFSSDYRPTAPFSAMHTGGAALDAYLAMSFPFVACWLLGAPSRTRLAAALALLLLGGYAGLATFSRDVYLAYVCSGVVIGALALAHQRSRGRLDWRKATLTGALIVVAALLLQQVFATSGYRGMLAALGLLGAAALLAATGRRALASGGAAAGTVMVAMVSITLVLLLAVTAVFFVLRHGAAPGADKGAYVGYALTCAVMASGVMLARFGGPGGRNGHILTAAAFPALALSTALVANHWGGAAAWADIGLLITLAAALIALRCWHGQPLWPLHRHSVGLGLFCAIAMAVTIPLSGSYYMGSRFATVSGDFGVRLGHWSEALQMMDGGAGTQAFGMGLGRYPATYLWNNNHGEHPPTFAYTKEDGNLFLRLGPPRYQAGYGEVLRVLQHVDLHGGVPYRMALDVRRGDDRTGMTVAVCERWLLYPESCAVAPIVLKQGERGWVHYEVPLTAELPPRRWPLRAPTQLEISVDGGIGVVDVDNVRLVDTASGQNLVANGDFSQANDHWFFSSDHNHFPWHVKNFAVDVVFEMGWCGAFAMALLLLPLAAGLAGRGLRGELDASVHLAALAGLMAVGMFDSIIDVPRLTLLFALIVFAAALVPAARPKAAAQRVRRRRALAEA